MDSSACRKFLFCLLLGIFTCEASAIAAHGSLCKVDDVYLCRSAYAVTKCSKVETCRQKVWPSWTIDQKTSKQCRFCVTVIHQLSQLVGNGTSKDAIATFLRKACSRTPSSSVASKCRRRLSSSSIYKLLRSQVDVSLVCGMTRFCKRSDDTTRKLDRNRPSAVLSGKTSVRNSEWCNRCKVFFKNVYDWLRLNSTKVEIETLLKNEVCSRLEIEMFIKQCESIVVDGVPKLLHVLIDNLDPNTVCKNLMCCPNTVSRKAGVDKQSLVRPKYPRASRKVESGGRCVRLLSSYNRILKSAHRASNTTCDKCVKAASTLTVKARVLQRLTHAAWMKQMMCRGPTSSSSCVHSVRARSVQVMSQMTRSSALHACTATGVCSRATLNHRVDL